VLRISRVDDNPSETTLHVEGRIVSEWVSVLEDQCRNALRAPLRVRLDLAGVTFVDPRGVELLRSLPGERTRGAAASRSDCRCSRDSAIACSARWNDCDRRGVGMSEGTRSLQSFSSAT